MNWKSLTIGKKIAVGFGIVLALLAAEGILSYTGVGGIVNNAKQVIDGNKLDGMLAQKEIDHLSWSNQVNALLTDESVTTLEVQTDDHKCGFGQWLYGQARKDAERLVPNLAPLLKEIEAPHKKLHESAIAISKVFTQANANLPTIFAEREVDHLKWASKVRDALLRGDETLDVQTDPEQCALGKWLHSEEAKHTYANGDAEYKKAWEEMLAAHKELHASAMEIQRNLKISNEAARQVFESKTLSVLTRTLKFLEELKKEAEHELHGMHEANQIYVTQTIPALQNVRALIKKIRSEARDNIMTDEGMLNAAQGTKLSVSIVGIAAIVIGILLAFFIARGIVVILTKISSQMNEGADQVAAASGQVSSASQQLAEGASEQAASIEETSSSLEEMSAMTQQNAGNANQADNLMKEANQVVKRADESMNELTKSMHDISKASEETFKIIKTIDEIAFQTNLLALNAAVEAARAGEAGAGFAVVADEVRNLAMRAADAAKNTAGLIEGTVKKVKEGGDLVATTNEAFTEVAASAAKVGELVAEIAAASNEQAQGIEQVNKAVTEMDKVVQQNAANAEESASASEEMNAQAVNMKGFVGDLVALVSGNNGNKAKSTPELSYMKSEAPAKAELLAPVINENIKITTQKGRVCRPEQIIPLEEDFKDF